MLTDASALRLDMPKPHGIQGSHNPGLNHTVPAILAMNAWISFTFNDMLCVAPFHARLRFGWLLYWPGIVICVLKGLSS